ncbi:MAG TPA: RNase A-like domain-containing protein [Motilibacteraceae bacterium]|nr:RNase A-like domain-containing protein [Motilibacteraceae bacterium]
MTRSPLELQADYPMLAKVLDGFYDGTSEAYVDVVEVLDVGLHALALDGRLHDVVAETRRLREEIDDDEDLLLHRLVGSDVFLPTGVLDVDLQLLAARALHWVEHGLPPVRPYFGTPAPLPRVSSWSDRETAEAAVSEVLRAHRSFVESWAANPEGQPRIWVSADLRRELGAVMLRAEEPGEEPRRLSSEVTQAVVVMARVPEGVFVRTSYPDLPLDPEWASRLPDLAHVFGAWFGQDMAEDGRTVYKTFFLVAARLNEPARTRVVAQLGQLMRLPEPDVRSALHALGSYALPEQADVWLERLHWALSSWPAELPVDAPLDSLDA